jgi:3-oxoadipate enol-lactonase
VPTVRLNDITVNYSLEGDGAETLVLVNGLADDLESWGFQMPDLLDAGLRVLRFDNRGIGATDRPAGPYTARQLADDTKALVDHLELDRFHLLGVSMGGMIAQEYALAYGQDLASLTLACTYAAPGPFCSRMFALWADMARQMGVPAVMRDVTLWAFTVPFFSDRPDDAAEFETAMAGLDQSLEAYLAQLNVIQTHDTTQRLAGIGVPTLVLAGEEDILIPVRLSRSLQDAIPGARWATVPGGHACLWESPGPFNQTVIDFVREHAK